jgi:hypothetical protein
LLRGRGKFDFETTRSEGAKEGARAALSFGGRPRVAGAWERGGWPSATISAAAQRFARSSLVSTGMVGSLVKGSRTGVRGD